MNVFSKLFFSLNETEHHEQIKYFKSPAIKTNFNIEKEVLYESYIPIEAIVFYMGAYHTNDGEVNEIVKNVLEAKKLLVADRNMLTYFLNTNEENIENSAKGILKFRNKMVKKDKSVIFKNLIIKKQMNLMERYKEEMNILDPEIDDQYKEMILRLKSDITNGENIVTKIQVEKENFYKNYLNVSDDDKFMLMMELSLGGFIVRLPSLYQNISKINIQKKSEAVRKWIQEFMKIVEDLELRTRNKPLIDQKLIILEFLKGCLYRKDSKFDKIFEMRSEILDLSLETFGSYMDENVKQEEEIKKMMIMVENIRTGIINIKYSKDITEKYINYLISGMEKDKEKLLKEFEHYTEYL